MITQTEGSTRERHKDGPTPAYPSARTETAPKAPNRADQYGPTREANRSRAQLIPEGSDHPRHMAHFRFTNKLGTDLRLAFLTSRGGGPTYFNVHGAIVLKTGVDVWELQSLKLFVSGITKCGRLDGGKGKTRPDGHQSVARTPQGRPREMTCVVPGSTHARYSI